MGDESNRAGRLDDADISYLCLGLDVSKIKVQSLGGDVDVFNNSNVIGYETVDVAPDDEEP